VKWHQDFLFTPHSNDDIITALLMVSDVTPENGPLNVVPGSHQGPLWSHWQDGRFTGAVDDEVVSAQCQQPPPALARQARCALCIPACFTPPAPMKPAAADAVYQRLRRRGRPALWRKPAAKPHAGQLVAGEESGLVRSTANQLRLPQKPRGASFFVQQAGHDLASM
jgi:hypothetical protein